MWVNEDGLLKTETKTYVGRLLYIKMYPLNSVYIYTYIYII